MVVETLSLLNGDASFAHATNKHPRRAFYIVCEKLYAVCRVVTKFAKQMAFASLYILNLCASWNKTNTSILQTWLLFERKVY